MRHPLIHNKSLLYYYAGFWLLAAITNYLLLVYGQAETVKSALVDSISSFILYPLLGLSIWFVIRYNKIEEQNWRKHLLYHLFVATAYNLLWLSLSVGLYKAFHLANDINFWQETTRKALVGYILYGLHVLFFYTQNYYTALREKNKRENELKMLVREAELNALKSQINPHFLFNSLNSISSLTITKPEKAQEMLIKLSTFMRYSLQNKPNNLSSLNEELENAQLYLDIEKVRFGNRLQIEFQIPPECLNALIPNLILQPVLENAIKYGVYESTEPTTLQLKCKRQQGFLIVQIENEYHTNALKNKGEGIGLNNIRQRMMLIYNNPHLINITQTAESFSVQFTFPQEIVLPQINQSN